ncbi:MAG: alpha/beta fold hydrolase [Longimicrobiales bacterium]
MNITLRIVQALLAAPFAAHGRLLVSPPPDDSGSAARARTPGMKAAVFISTVLLSTAASAQAQEPTTGYAPVNGLSMYYEIHGNGSGEPLVLLHGSFMTISNNWTGWIAELSKTRKVIAVEMQGHGRTADIDRDFSYENLADDVAALLDFLEVPRADLLGYSMGGGVAMQVAIRHSGKVRKVVSVSAVFRHDGWVQEAFDAFPQMTAEAFKGSPLETEYRRLSPTPDEFPTFVERVIAMDLKPYDFGADELEATTAPFFFIHGDADGVRLDHIAEMFRLKGAEIFGDMRPRSESRLAILPNTTHVTLMEQADVIIPMVNEFLDTSSQNN